MTIVRTSDMPRSIAPHINFTTSSRPHRTEIAKVLAMWQRFAPRVRDTDRELARLAHTFTVDVISDAIEKIGTRGEDLTLENVLVAASARCLRERQLQRRESKDADRGRTHE
jgi:hypothetical protein